MIGEGKNINDVFSVFNDVVTVVVAEVAGYEVT